MPSIGSITIGSDGIGAAPLSTVTSAVRVTQIAKEVLVRNRNAQTGPSVIRLILPGSSGAHLSGLGKISLMQ